MKAYPRVEISNDGGYKFNIQGYLVCSSRDNEGLIHFVKHTTERFELESHGIYQKDQIRYTGEVHWEGE